MTYQVSFYNDFREYDTRECAKSISKKGTIDLQREILDFRICSKGQLPTRMGTVKRLGITQIYTVTYLGNLFYILNYTSDLNAYPTNESLQACKTACKHRQAGSCINYANADDIGVNLQPVKIKHMAN